MINDGKIWEGREQGEQTGRWGLQLAHQPPPA